MKSLYRKLHLALLCLGTAALAQGCGMELTKDDPGKPGSHPNSLTLVRKYQRVQRYTCAGALRSDQIESVASPEQWVTITPDGGRKATTVDIRNRQNGDTITWWMDNVTFLVKFHTTEGGLKVERGLNIVDYSFGTAQGPENGTVSFDITYREDNLEGTSVQHDPCPTPSATP